MPSYRFRLEGNAPSSHGMDLDLPDETVILPVARQVARRLASRELETGQLFLSKDLIVFDSADTEVARYPLADFIHIA